MIRPTFLVAEREPGAALSTRKLVLETAKFNVLTAHTSKEAAEVLAVAPALIAALIVSSDIHGAESLVAQLKKKNGDIPVICMSPNRTAELKGADHHVSSHEPEELVELCRELFGDPRDWDRRTDRKG
jgi:hypothetical protein